MNTAGGIFFTRWWESEGEYFWRFENFSKLKTAFCEYWTSIKIKISMIYVLKEYEIKTKMVQEQWLQLKKTFLFFVGLNWLLVGGNKNLVGSGWMSKFLVRGGTLPSLSRENPVQTLPTGFYIQWRSSVHITYIIFQSGHLTSTRFEHFLCHRYVWYIFSLSLFSVCNTINLSDHEHV